jgi:ParB family chromosome partitioning protein
MITLAVTENIQREDLTPLEEGKLFQTMIRDMGLTQIKIATAVNKDCNYIRHRLRLAQAPEDIQKFASTKTGTMRIRRFACWTLPIPPSVLPSFKSS